MADPAGLPPPGDPVCRIEIAPHWTEALVGIETRDRLPGREGNVPSLRGLDCVDGTPLIDLKPDCGGHPFPNH